MEASRTDHGFSGPPKLLGQVTTVFLLHTNLKPRIHAPPQTPPPLPDLLKTQTFARIAPIRPVGLLRHIYKSAPCLAIIRKCFHPTQIRAYTDIQRSDLVMCRKQSGISIGRLCDKCDGKCPVCDSYVRPTTLARICDECSFGNYQNKCVVCGGEGISDAFYCFECTRLEKDRDGCPKIINLGSSRTDLFYQKKNFRNH